MMVSWPCPAVQQSTLTQKIEHWKSVAIFTLPSYPLHANYQVHARIIFTLQFLNCPYAMFSNVKVCHVKQLVLLVGLPRIIIYGYSIIKIRMSMNFSPVDIKNISVSVYLSSIKIKRSIFLYIWYIYYLLLHTFIQNRNRYKIQSVLLHCIAYLPPLMHLM